MTTDFSEWLAREMPAGTVIGNPLWWASKIVDYRARALLDQPELTDDKLMDIACATDLVYCMGEGYGFASRYQEEADITAEVLAFARAVIAADRARRPTPQPPAAQEKAWRWWAYHPEESLDLYQTPEQARKQAIDWLNEDRSNACLDGWHEEQEKVSWGYLVPIENAQITERRAVAEDDLLYTSLGIDEIDEIVSYEMLPANALPTPEAQ